MVRFCILLFIFLQACSPIRGLFNISDPKTNNYWWITILQGNVGSAYRENSETLDENENALVENVFPENLDAFNENVDALGWTLLVGAPNANTVDSRLAIDTNGFIYLAGSTDGGVYNEDPIGVRDIILGKYDSRKNVIWTKQVGVPGVNLSVVDVGVDEIGNVYIAGNTTGNFAQELRSGRDLFVIKFDPNGREVWRRQTGPIGERYSVSPEKIFVDPNGTSYIVGMSNGPFGGLTPGRNGFLFKIDEFGTERWRIQISIPGAEIFPEGVVVAHDTGDVFVTGSGNANFENDTTPGAGNEDLFILKYNRAGRKQFFAQLGNALNTTEGTSVTLDTFGNLFVGGKSNANFDPGGASGTSSRGTLVKYDSSGVRQWIRQLGPIDGRRNTKITAITTDALGNVYATGRTDGNVMDGSENSIGFEDAFLTKYDSFGNREWARQMGSTLGTGIRQDPQGNFYWAGLTNTSLNEIQPAGLPDLFLLKFR
ncbi:SBBP repeat beta-propeller lipoprotein, LipL53 family [Leptospira alstonii]|uniref:Beta-propeller repeat protein n=2 Tax=Leptospira alstonii TaxID=28452 RepID=M6CQV5_9LEPT|nr:SBBP repeat-containing protein [Leptospira alstonii]EMJ94322.1 beta-propeller repeat protein [Leptospira alstonii serovar Sichuan str. 79601]EQA81200.1 beta-propeller repeat protein [Leptospira alstonii serovar Pingchang str. 80-412]